MRRHNCCVTFMEKIAALAIGIMAEVKCGLWPRNSEIAFSSLS